jgi:ABC-2 type transport system permease protein
MNRTLIDLKASFKMFYRSRTALFWTFAFPCIMIILFGAIFSRSITSYDLYIQNKDLDINGNPTTLSKAFIDSLNLTSAFNIHYLDRTVNATRYALDNKLSYLIVIPEGFHNDTLKALVPGSTSNSKIQFIYDQSQTSSIVVMGIVNGVASKMNQAYAQQGFLHDYIVLEGETIAPKRLSYMDFFIPGVLGMAAMTSSIFAAVEISGRYRETGIFHKLATTPLKRIEWIVSRTIYQIVICFIGMALIIGIGMAFFNVKVIPDPLSLILVATTSMTFSGFGMILSRFVKDPEAAGAAANAITFPMMFLSGSFFPLEQMPEFLRSIATVLPLTYVNNGLRATMILGEPQQAVTNVIIVAVLGIASLLVGAWITKWEEE